MNQAFSPSDVQAITFDCYGTLIDWDSGVAIALQPVLDRERGVVDADTLLGRFAEAQWRHERSRPFKPYRQVLRDALLEIADELDLGVSLEEASAFGGSVGSWPAFPDSAGALAKLKQRYLLGVVSNVDRESFSESSHKLGDPFREVVTADDVHAYKPEPQHFEEMLRRLEARGIGRESVLHVAQSRAHDIEPANTFGLRSIWVDRRGDRPGRGINMPSDAQPIARVESMTGVLELLGMA